ncbi:hypothetical protein [Roseivirga sp. UBA838]|uniref:hypothetical protein n=1 Tax=Roseivirga sp. UBA838 TaxID=1947393 RepID=UPI00257F7739|nr:hypothetical protein [Roseivirga sp. UBA838]|tara:strand:- start:32889 stop:33326 length:438 start_codon:yes stop_codon:yes gene_type:complete
MSDVSVLSKQFEKLVKLSNSFNESVILHKKKKHLGSVKGKYSSLNLSKDSLSEANRYLLSFLENLIHVVNDNSYSTEYLPSIILEDYTKRIKLTPYLTDELQEIINKLKSSKGLSNENIELLDKLLSELDSEKNILYKKLRSGRG